MSAPTLTGDTNADAVVAVALHAVDAAPARPSQRPQQLLPLRRVSPSPPCAALTPPHATAPAPGTASDPVTPLSPLALPVPALTSPLPAPPLVQLAALSPPAPPAPPAPPVPAPPASPAPLAHPASPAPLAPPASPAPLAPPASPASPTAPDGASDSAAADCVCAVCATGMGVPSFQSAAVDVDSDDSATGDDARTDADPSSESKAPPRTRHTQLQAVGGRRATYTLRCGHTFHVKCFVKAAIAAGGRRCPVCRQGSPPRAADPPPRAATTEALPLLAHRLRRQPAFYDRGGSNVTWRAPRSPSASSASSSGSSEGVDPWLARRGEMNGNSGNSNDRTAANADADADAAAAPSRGRGRGRWVVLGSAALEPVSLFTRVVANTEAGGTGTNTAATATATSTGAAVNAGADAGTSTGAGTGAVVDAGAGTGVVVKAGVNADVNAGTGASAGVDAGAERIGGLLQDVSDTRANADARAVLRHHVQALRPRGYWAVRFDVTLRAAETPTRGSVGLMREGARLHVSTQPEGQPLGTEEVFEWTSALAAALSTLAMGGGAVSAGGAVGGGAVSVGAVGGGAASAGGAVGGGAVSVGAGDPVRVRRGWSWSRRSSSSSTDNNSDTDNDAGNARQPDPWLTRRAGDVDTGASKNNTAVGAKDTATSGSTVADAAVADTAVADTAVADTAVADTAVANTAVADTAVADTAVVFTPGVGLQMLPTLHLALPRTDAISRDGCAAVLRHVQRAHDPWAVTVDLVDGATASFMRQGSSLHVRHTQSAGLEPRAVELPWLHAHQALSLFAAAAAEAAAT